MNVIYMDGEVDQGLVSNSIKPFKPYEVGEIIEVDPDEDEFFKAKILKISGNELVVKPTGHGHSRVTFTVNEVAARRFY